MKRKYKESEVPGVVEGITQKFEDACATYKLALSMRESNRAKKELFRGNTRGTSIHKFQSNFAWIVHYIECGHRCQIEDQLEEAEELIAHINKISNT